MPKEFAQTINGRCFHFKISDTVLAKTKIGEPVYQVRISDAQSQYSSLWAIKTGTGNSNPLLKTIHKIFDQGGGATADIGITDLSMDLGMCYKRME